MFSNFQSSAAVPLPGVKVQMAIPQRTATSSGVARGSSATAANRRSVGSSSDAANQAVANSIEALQRCCDLQAKRAAANRSPTQQQQQQQQQQHDTHDVDPLTLMSPTASSGGRGIIHLMRGGAATMPQAASASDYFNQSPSGSWHPAANPSSNSMLPPSPSKMQQQMREMLASDAIMRNKAQIDQKYQTGFTAFEFALETVMQRMDKMDKARKLMLKEAKMQQQQQQGQERHATISPTTPEAAAADQNNNSSSGAPSIEERWRILADCLTSASLNVDLHKICSDVEATIDELNRQRAFQIAQEQRSNAAAGAVGGASGLLALLSPKKREQAKNRINGTQTAMAVMLLEQALHALGDAAPYSQPALQWVLDTVLGSIYVSYDIVRSDLATSFEPLCLEGNPGAADPVLRKGNAEKLISRFYGKTFFQSVRSLSTAARAHAEHAEEIERSKTRQSRVLERAISYWARYSMRRVLGAWRGFAKNEKIERHLREQVDELSARNKLLQEINDQRERDQISNINLTGTSHEALQLQVRELQRALEFERRRATRAEAALAVRIVEEGHQHHGSEGRSPDGSPIMPQHRVDGGGSNSSGQFGRSPSMDLTALRAEVAHYRAVAVEACRLGDIDLHELERAVSAQTNVLARGMNG